MTKEIPQFEVELKESFKIMKTIVDENSPEVYKMPVLVYNEIMKKLVYLERALQQVRESRDNWKSKYEGSKK